MSILLKPSILAPADIAADRQFALHPSRVGWGRFFKRLMDVAGALVGLLALAPIYLLVAVAIKLESRGPVLFRQVRVGMDGKPFTMLKFRSMVVDAEERLSEVWHLNEMTGGPIFKAKEDPRITRVGRFLRRTSLDEFPQFWNVLVADMSLVGPRPPLPAEVATYGPREMERLGVLPGATGLWQVSGRSSLKSFERMVDLDWEYMHAWSLRGDLDILWRTLGVVLRMAGSC